MPFFSSNFRAITAILQVLFGDSDQVQHKPGCTITEGGQARGLKFWELREISVIMQLISAFVFAYAKSRFSHNAAHIGMEFSFVSRCQTVFVSFLE